MWWYVLRSCHRLFLSPGAGRIAIGGRRTISEPMHPFSVSFQEKPLKPVGCCRSVTPCSQGTLGNGRKGEEPPNSQSMTIPGPKSEKGRGGSFVFERIMGHFIASMDTWSSVGGVLGMAKMRGLANGCHGWQTASVLSVCFLKLWVCQERDPKSSVGNLLSFSEWLTPQPSQDFAHSMPRVTGEENPLGASLFPQGAINLYPSINGGPFFPGYFGSFTRFCFTSSS
jgi:hypothetical protein